MVVPFLYIIYLVIKFSLSLYIYIDFKLNSFSEHLVFIYVTMCMTISLMHGRIKFPRIYKFTYKFVGGLLHHVYDELYCMWSNRLLRYIGTVFHQNKII